jgi:hypothetical protein
VVGRAHAEALLQRIWNLDNSENLP